MTEETEQETPPKPGFMSVLGSVIAAAFGVQNEANRERDFSQRNPLPYILAGIGFTVAFVLVLAGVVTLVLG